MPHLKRYIERLTQRASEGWWAPRFELDSSEEFGPVSLAGSPSRRYREPLGAEIEKPGL